jgi:hypothetical protein
MGWVWDDGRFIFKNLNLFILFHVTLLKQTDLSNMRRAWCTLVENAGSVLLVNNHM